MSKTCAATAADGAEWLARIPPLLKRLGCPPQSIVELLDFTILLNICIALQNQLLPNQRLHRLGSSKQEKTSNKVI